MLIVVAKEVSFKSKLRIVKRSPKKQLKKYFSTTLKFNILFYII